MRLHHVQVSGPAGCEDAMREFYVGVLGMSEIDKPDLLRSRGGAWFRAGSAELHVGIVHQQDRVVVGRAQGAHALHMKHLSAKGDAVHSAAVLW